MRVRFSGKRVLVTGGGTGIGAAIAARFRHEDADVIVMGRRPEPLEEVASATPARPTIVAVPSRLPPSASAASTWRCRTRARPFPGR